MRKLIIPAILTLAVCATAVYLAAGKNGLPPGGARLIADVPSMSAAEAASHRQSRYAAIDSIEDLLALPGHFARMEALYALAGRSDSAAVQNLIFQADGIADLSDREDVLFVLFARLTELDAPSALALSGTSGFVNDRDLEREVWQRWGALDLNAAVRAARQLETPAHRNLAAQALLAAYDYWGNETTTRIAELLETRPDDATRALYLYSLADRDPHAAIGYVKALESAHERAQAAMWLGRHFGRDDPQQAREYAALLGDLQLRNAYASALVQFAAHTDPRSVLDAALENGFGRDDRASAFSALRALAEQDIDQALAYVERADNREQQEIFAQIVGPVLAEQDPERALAWARELDPRRRRSVYGEVLATIAYSDPELALSEGSSLPSAQSRREAYGTIAMSLAQQDLERAISFVDRIDSPSERHAAAQVVTSIWIQSAPEEAVSWILQQDPELREEMMSDVAGWLPQQDPDAAMRLLPRLSDGTARVWRARVAGALAADRSLDEALGFIAAFEGSDEYPQLFSMVVSGLAQRDAPAAIQLAGTLAAGEHRDSLYQSLVPRVAAEDPRRAALLLDSIADAEQRMNATRQLASSWARNDPEAAEQWVRNLPEGRTRDGATAALVDRWRELTPSRRRIIEEIGDPDIRRHAVFNFVFRTARFNPADAERIIRSFNLPDAESSMMLEQLEAIRNQEPMIHSNY